MPANRQLAVSAMVMRQLTARVAWPELSRAQQAALRQLIRRVGTSDFCGGLSRADVERSAAWLTMKGVQRDFARAEPGFTSDTTRALHLREGNLGQRGPYERFLQLHTTAFSQTGKSA